MQKKFIFIEKLLSTKRIRIMTKNMKNIVIVFLTVILLSTVVSQTAFADCGCQDPKPVATKDCECEKKQPYLTKEEHIEREAVRLQEYTDYFLANGFRYHTNYICPSHDDDLRGVWLMKGNLAVLLAWEKGIVDRSNVHIHRILIRETDKTIELETKYGNCFNFYQHNDPTRYCRGPIPIRAKVARKDIAIITGKIDGFKRYKNTVQRLLSFFDNAQI